MGREGKGKVERRRRRLRKKIGRCGKGRKMRGKKFKGKT